MDVKESIKETVQETVKEKGNEIADNALDKVNGGIRLKAVAEDAVDKVSEIAGGAVEIAAKHITGDFFR